LDPGGPGQPALIIAMNRLLIGIATKIIAAAVAIVKETAASTRETVAIPGPAIRIRANIIAANLFRFYYHLLEIIYGMYYFSCQIKKDCSRRTAVQMPYWRKNNMDIPSSVSNGERPLLRLVHHRPSVQQV